MFDIAIDLKRGLYLKWVERPRRPFERGLWIEIGHAKEPGIMRIVERNRQLGLDVMIDENNIYRALVLKD